MDSGKTTGRPLAEPEVVHATIGGSNEKEAGPALDAAVRSVSVFNTAQVSAQRKPMYQWKPEDPLSSGNNPPAKSINAFSCGNIIMPQHKFYVAAAINLSHADERQRYEVSREQKQSGYELDGEEESWEVGCRDRDEELYSQRFGRRLLMNEV